ncbi:unnamed protein product, partial [Linum tenue]
GLEAHKGIVKQGPRRSRGPRWGTRGGVWEKGNSRRPPYDKTGTRPPDTSGRWCQKGDLPRDTYLGHSRNKH